MEVVKTRVPSARKNIPFTQPTPGMLSLDTVASRRRRPASLYLPLRPLILGIGNTVLKPFKKVLGGLPLGRQAQPLHFLIF